MLGSLEIAFPATLEDASELAIEAGDDASFYAGGAELAVLLRYGLASCRYLIDLKRIEGMSATVRVRSDGVATVGALATHSSLASNPNMVEKFPALATAESRIGNVRIRNQGTIGGNVCFADPSSDPTAPLLLYDTELQLRSAKGARSLRLEDFVSGPYQTALVAGEILTELLARPLGPGWRERYLRIERFTRPTAGVAVACRLEDGVVADVRLAVASATSRPSRLRQLEKELHGLSPQEALTLLQGSREVLSDLLQPHSDLLGTAEYKLHLVQVLLRRGLELCCEGAA